MGPHAATIFFCGRRFLLPFDVSDLLVAANISVRTLRLVLIADNAWVPREKNGKSAMLVFGACELLLSAASWVIIFKGGSG